MRTMRASLVGTVTLALLIGVGGAVVAQETEPTLEETVLVRGTQQHVSEIGDEGDWLGTTARRFGMSDPRLDGEATFDTWVGYLGDEPEWADQPPHVVWSTFTVTNDEGAWHGRSVGFVDHEANELHQIGWLEGDGAYEGLTFIEQIGPPDFGRWDVVGVLYEGGIPPVLLPAGVAD
jgi:hypothetical protein